MDRAAMRGCESENNIYLHSGRKRVRLVLELAGYVNGFNL
jgi:hypothetical protein